ncbi:MULTISPECIES: iron-sulfur cluster biosynthesis family protein [Paenibacillus]|uniref:iron-sulfur cluster biosynthesis family protein n=1 Tax=Paenibacillus TaxID=44249 RepID=UPI002041FADC|nr:iron-sulfur cluster biosynthesis family protein [Paenibacillus camelliae]MCM3632956.1 iron-sulfur cluster biosynthesis family protein [Paenibacillus camelliae]
MRITFTTEAVHKLQLLLKDKKLKFLHDIEGCGCVVSGVPTLTTIDSPTEDDRAGEADPLPFYYEPRHKVYYEDHMKIHYDTDKNAFSLKSDAQIYTLNLRFVP